MAACSFSKGLWDYDVFLSFRGEDTRRSFICHLHKALKQKAITTFIDTQELRKGNNLSELFKAIDHSRLSLVVFSENYASSTWCLKELVHILQCMDAQKQIVVPIFYQVDPSAVRHLEGSFAEAFAKHENHSKTASKEEVMHWKSALVRATMLSGWDSRNYEDDVKFLQDIVEDTFTKLIQKSSSKSDGLVGMNSHIHIMNRLLSCGVDDVRIVGIWGMGGIGKTTIARAVFDKISHQFEHCCFLHNVKEGFLTKYGAVHMQEEFLSRILEEKHHNLGTLDRGSNMIMERLGKKKVLVVLDDVDNLDQIETLIGKKPSFGGGSRIIITTRDRHLLGGSMIYKPQSLTHDKALELFRQYAFRTNPPSREYDDLSRRAITYAQGLPLALKVLGAFLDNKSVHEWEDELEKLKEIPHKGIQGVLRTSFDGLDDSQKNIFLDIACFFRGMGRDYVTEVLDNCGLFPHGGLRVLVDRALITISSFPYTLEMHDLLQEMGRQIGRCSRLWRYEDVDRILTTTTTLEAVEGIVLPLDLSQIKEVYLNTEAFVSMTKLRLVQINYKRPKYQFGLGESMFRSEGVEPQAHDDDRIQHLSGDLKFRSHELRVLVWHRYPLKSLSFSFHPKNLVYLDMPCSQIEQLWEGTKPLRNLIFMNLSHSRYLRKTPDFTEATKLKELHLEGCTSLVEVHPSISALEKLVYLNLKGCKDLKMLPSSSNMKVLKFLDISGCSYIDDFPETSEVMKELSWLYLDGTAIKELPSSINSLSGLCTLSLRGCKELKSLPSSIHMKSLKILDLSGCSNVEKFPEVSEVMKELSHLYLDETAIKELPSSINSLSGLCTLSLRGCEELKSLPSSIHMKSPEVLEVMKELSHLYLDGTAIEELPSSINNLSRLCTLSLSGCKDLKCLPSSINMKSLELLDLSDCLNLEKFPEVSDVMTKLSYLYLDGTAIKQLPSSINNLSGLLTLSLIGCKELKCLPSSIHMKCLALLHLCDCSNLEKFPEIGKDMKKLSQLYLDGTAIRELPSSIERLKRLELLCMRNCRNLVSLPDSICNLTRLEELSLAGCSKLSNIPQNLVNIESLRTVEVEGSGIKALSFPLFKHHKTSYPSNPWPSTHDNHGSFFVDLGSVGNKRKRDEQTKVRVSGEEEWSDSGEDRDRCQQLWPVWERQRET